MSWRWLWPFGRKRREPSPELVAAQEKLDEVRSKGHEVSRLAADLRRIRERNNFAAMFGGEGFQERRR